MKNKLAPLIVTLGVLGTLVAISYLLRQPVLAVGVYAFGGIVGLAWLMPKLWLDPITVEREVSEDVINIGDTVRVITKIHNPSPWPVLWLYAEETLPERMPSQGMTRRLLFLPPGRSFHLLYRITVNRRGCHQIGPLVLESGDVFGLFRKFRVEPQRDFVTALPKSTVIEEYQVGSSRKLGEITAARSVFEDMTSVRGVRDYRAGDPLKSVHWKNSARTGRLQTKLYDPVTEAGATLILDFHRETWEEAAQQYSERNTPASELAVELVNTVARYLLEGRWKVGLFSNGRDPLGLPGVTMGEVKGTDSMRLALEAAKRAAEDDRLEPINVRASRRSVQFSVINENLGRVALSDGLQIEELLPGELPYIEREQALVFVTGRVTDPFIGCVHKCRQLGYRVMVFVVENNEAHDRAFEAFVPVGAEVYRMDNDWRVKEIATGRRSF